MTILWITNILFPEAVKLLTGSGELKSSGGWMLGAANALLQNRDINLVVASVSSLVSKLTKIEGENIIYYILPLGKGNITFNLDYIPYWKQVQQEIQPSVTHIHGTEFSHGHAYLKACGSDNVVVSIQGLVSGIFPFYLSGLSTKDILFNLTIRDILRDNLFQQQHQFRERSYFEIETLKMAKHVIGRTSWDKARVWAINPDAIYHFCNETLRPEFYDGSVWNYNKCTKHSIFLSQAEYPIKGLHQVLKAMPLILRSFPDTTLRIAGNDITISNSLSSRLRLSGYGKYILALIKKYSLQDHVSFTGSLNGEEMKKEYLKANVFICPSAIENSPNSLGEAQILGVPCVTAYAGGIPDMMIGCEENMYRFEEIEMLAEIVCRIFSSQKNCNSMLNIALKRHCIKDNSERLYSIYKSIVGL